MRTEVVTDERAIELSEWSHVELALYARGLEMDRRQLIELVQLVKRELTGLHRQDDTTPHVRKTIEGILIALQIHPSCG